MTKIVLICVTSQGVLNFRKTLILSMIKNGINVSVIAFDDRFEKDITQIGAHFYCVGGSNRSINPLRMMSIRREYERILRRIKPDIVFCFQLKPNLLGVVAAKKAGVNRIFAMVEGAGEPFTFNSLKWRIIRFFVCKLYKKSLRYVDKVFFLNQDDANEFNSRSLIDKQKAVVTNGIGVDLDYFSFQEFDFDSNDFLMVSRLNHSKGVYTYIKAAEYVKKIHPEARFFLAGAEGTIQVSDIDIYIKNGTITYSGVVKDVRPILKQCFCFILPSFYREGLPASIMEAESTGRCVITTNNVGCKDTVDDGYNGFIIEKHDWKELAHKCLYLLENKEVAKKLGKNARTFAEKKFDSKVINQTIISYIL